MKTATPSLPVHTALAFLVLGAGADRPGKGEDAERNPRFRGDARRERGAAQSRPGSRAPQRCLAEPLCNGRRCCQPPTNALPLLVGRGGLVGERSGRKDGRHSMSPWAWGSNLLGQADGAWGLPRFFRKRSSGRARAALDSRVSTVRKRCHVPFAVQPSAPGPSNGPMWSWGDLVSPRAVSAFPALAAQGPNHCPPKASARVQQKTRLEERTAQSPFNCASAPSPTCASATRSSYRGRLAKRSTRIVIVAQSSRAVPCKGRSRKEIGKPALCGDSVEGFLHRPGLVPGLLWPARAGAPRAYGRDHCGVPAGSGARRPAMPSAMRVANAMMVSCGLTPTHSGKRLASAT